MDIATVETSDQQTLYMTLLGSWGLVADIDIESEKLRKIGETRFILGIYMYIYIYISNQLLYVGT